MASDSSPAPFNNGPSSPDDSLSSPIGNTFSSPAADNSRRNRRRGRSTTPSAFATPPPPQSRFATSESTPTPQRSRSIPRQAAVSTPSSASEGLPSSEGGDDMDEATPTDNNQSQGTEIFEEGKYMKAIHRVLEIEGEWLDVDAHDVFGYDSDLYTKMVRYPLEVLAIFDIVLMDIVSLINPLFEKHVQVRIYNLKTSTTMRSLNPSDIEKMVSLKGMIIRCSSIIPEIREAIFRCLVCGKNEPTVCMKQECLARNSMTLVHNPCRFADKQIVRLQETPDEIPEGGTPHTTYIDCLHIKKTDKSRMLAEDPMEIDNGSRRMEEDVQFDEVKLFGGNALKLPSGASFRGDINILLVGDPGTSKSQLLQYIHKLSPRGIYTSGRGSSAVGLTAYVSKDPETGETVLESGALVLSDRGICCIDFDKMSENARSMLHEVMEQQTVSIAKAGIIASLNARTSVLACANPIGSRYNPRLSVIDNIHLPPTLLSRFDLIYLILDKADEQTDRHLAKHIVSLHFENPEIAQQDVLDIATLTAYVSYARKHIHPKLSDEAAEELTRGYVEMRRRGNFPGSTKKVITATPRQIESLIRLSEALARIRLSEWVEKHDVIEAFRLLEVAMQQSATDHSTGTIDMDLITTGVSASERMRRENLVSATRNIIMEKLQLGGPSVRLLELLDELKKQSSTSEVHLQDLRNAVATLAGEGFVVFHGDSVKRV
ncbi:hypothetical protein GH714_031339 [Hevea brasiliensis]|uniref:DNA helicase n=1 Tax=Hevea brasiliensis TaxID=3981 RepID=A0A6A6NDF2_HEVBR|nr:hypothetical protein GH714_031339 [Hevea brasiliensis]